LCLEGRDCRNEQKGPASLPGLSFHLSTERLDLEVHTIHAAMPRPPAGIAAAACVLLRTSATMASVVISAPDRGRVLDRHTHDLVGR